MAKFRNGNMLDHLRECDMAFITTNSMVRKDGRLVMGRGIAQQVRDNFEDIDLDFGTQLQKKFSHKLPSYFLLQSTLYPKFWAFQVKWHWGDGASLELIRSSVECLKSISEHEYDKVIFLNFPGIGNGQLLREEVLPIVEELPNNVTIWEL